jgi:uncharacterized membrane protein HdeD (DUF308 family)
MNLKKWSASPLWPAFLSAVVAPGVGQFANREPGKGLFLLTAFLGSLFWLSKVVTDRLTALLPGSPETWATNKDALTNALRQLIEQTPDMFFTFQILIVVIWIFSIVDAYVGARHRARTGTTGPTL